MWNWKVFSRNTERIERLEREVVRLEAELKDATNITVYKKADTDYESHMYVWGYQERPRASIPVKKLLNQLTANAGIILEYSAPKQAEPASVFINNKS
jgi:hypothetical protein